MANNKLAVIGGSGLYDVEEFKERELIKLDTPWGKPSDDILNCESEGILGSTASIIGSIQANEALKIILGIGKNLISNILILYLLNLKFIKVLFKKIKSCICKKL